MMAFFSNRSGSKPTPEPAGYQELVAQSMEELRLKTAAHESAWHLSEASWSVNQEEGTIVFTCANGMRAICPVQIVGTYDLQDKTWLWGWDHPSVDAALQEHARRVREYGQSQHIARLTTQGFGCTEAEAWNFAALACKLCGAQGAYRGPAGQTLVFMTFGVVSLSRKPS